MRLLNLMGSRLEVESTYGEGSDFFFHLEQQRKDDQVIGEDIKEYCQKAKGTKREMNEDFYAPLARLLVVDDNKVNLKVFKGLLKNNGMQIDTAMSGKECLDLMKENKYHIVFLDHLMPDMDGVETLNQAKVLEDSKSQDAVMVILTANAVSGAREKFLQEGFDDYLSKPISLPLLKEMILKYLPKELIMYDKNTVTKVSDD